jgi:hypothetical protein
MRFLVTLGTWKILLNLRIPIWVWIKDLSMWLIVIPAPFVICTFSPPLYLSWKASLSSSQVIWSMPPWIGVPIRGHRIGSRGWCSCMLWIRNVIVGTLQTGYPRLHALSQDEGQDMHSHTLTCPWHRLCHLARALRCRHTSCGTSSRFLAQGSSSATTCPVAPALESWLGVAQVLPHVMWRQLPPHSTG